MSTLSVEASREVERAKKRVKRAEKRNRIKREREQNYGVLEGNEAKYVSKESLKASDYLDEGAVKKRKVMVAGPHASDYLIEDGDINVEIVPQPYSIEKDLESISCIPEPNSIKPELFSIISKYDKFEDGGASPVKVEAEDWCSIATQSVRALREDIRATEKHLDELIHCCSRLYAYETKRNHGKERSITTSSLEESQSGKEEMYDEGSGERCE